MKFSYAMLPGYPLEESLRAIKLADELGFHAVYAADETWHKDLWLLFAAASQQTSRIRMGPSLSGVVLREPSLIAQSAATLDELTGGRAEVVLGSGNFGLLAEYRIDWKQTKPLSRVIEGLHVVRTLLDEGAITFDGEFFRYDGLFTFARPVQERVPVKMGAMRGPRSFEAAAQFSDGCHQALSYSRQAYDYAAEHFRIGAEKAGKDWTTLDFGAWVVVAVGRDSAAAKEAARSMVGIYASSMPAEQLERHGVDPAQLQPIVDAIGAGDLAKGIELTTPELTDKLSFAGTPEEVTAMIKEIEPAGVNHIIAAINDASIVKAFTGWPNRGDAMTDVLNGTTTLAQERRLVTEIPGPRSRALMERRTAAVSSGVGGTLPVFVERAGGGVVVDVDGNSLIDLGSGIAVVSVGNAAPRVVAAVQEQVAAFTHTCFMVTPYEGYVAVCEELARLTPGSHAKKSALFNSGSEAVENAVKIARLATGRQAVVVFDHAYHGRTNLTMALTAKNMPYKHGFGPFAPEVYRVPMSYPLRDGGLSGPDAAARAVDLIEKQVGSGNVAAVLIEPIQGEGGFVVPAPGFLPAIEAWSRDAGAVFIADEI